MAFLGTAFVGTASAANVNCGDIILEDTVFDSDVGPCSIGITIGANNIDVDLAGHQVFGNPGTGEGPGITFNQVSGSRLRNGTVRNFDAGVLINRGSSNTVVSVRAVNNNGGGSFGDGIFVFRSDDNRILANQVSGNGPFTGMLIEDSNRTLVDGNAVQNNTQGTAIGIWILNNRDIPLSQDRSDPDLIGLQASDNLIVNNQVQGNALEGIQVSRFATRNTVRQNNTSQNGVIRSNNVRDGSGIAVFGNQNVIEENTAFGNGANGIVIFASTSATSGRAQGVNNQILRNTAFGNDVGTIATPSFDLLDQNPNCDNNRWRGNRARTFSPPCTITPESTP